MDQATKGSVPEDEELERFGYRQQFVRSLRHFESVVAAGRRALAAARGAPAHAVALANQGETVLA